MSISELPIGTSEMSSWFQFLPGHQPSPLVLEREAEFPLSCALSRAGCGTLAQGSMRLPMLFLAPWSGGASPQLC